MADRGRPVPLRQPTEHDLVAPGPGLPVEANPGLEPLDPKPCGSVSGLVIDGRHARSETGHQQVELEAEEPHAKRADGLVVDRRDWAHPEGHIVGCDWTIRRHPEHPLASRECPASVENLKHLKRRPDALHRLPGRQAEVPAYVAAYESLQHPPLESVTVDDPSGTRRNRRSSLVVDRVHRLERVCLLLERLVL